MQVYQKEMPVSACQFELVSEVNRTIDWHRITTERMSPIVETVERDFDFILYVVDHAHVWTRICVARLCFGASDRSYCSTSFVSLSDANILNLASDSMHLQL